MAWLAAARYAQSMMRASDGAIISGHGSFEVAGRFALLSLAASLASALFLGAPLALLVCSSLVFCIMLVAELAGPVRAIAGEKMLTNPVRRFFGLIYMAGLALFYLGINTVLILGLLAPRQNLETFATSVWCVAFGALIVDLEVRLWRLTRS